MSKVIIGIHGLANKPARVVHCEGWIKSMQEGLLKNTTFLGAAACAFEASIVADVYWADLMYPSPSDNEPYIEAKPGALKVYKDRHLDELRAQLQGRLGWVADQVKATIGLDAVADAVLQAKLKDLAFYYDEDGKITDRHATQRLAREVLQDELIAVIQAHKGRDIMLIGHSMGSIIAYDVLRRLGQESGTVCIRHLVTLGSPLGLPHVKLKAEKFFADGVYGDATLRTPTIVEKSWVNFADPKDPVAFDTHLGDDFGPNSGGVRVRDVLILNDYESSGRFNHHKIYGYLRAPEFSKHLNDFLGDRL
ncbi:MAG TPA: alpha/beta hydrolase [Burkholderiales bacterium]|nr:alpha/beta hydrolase [Burkholderiales bacterium]